MASASATAVHDLFRDHQDKIARPTENGHMVDGDLAACKPGAEPPELASADQVQVLFLCKEIVIDPPHDAPEHLFREPVHNRHQRVKFDRKPAIGRRDECRATRHARQLADESSLVVGAADVLEDRARVSEIKRPVIERQVAPVRPAERQARIELLQERGIVETDGRFLCGYQASR